MTAYSSFNVLSEKPFRKLKRRQGSVGPKKIQHVQCSPALLGRTVVNDGQHVLETVPWGNPSASQRSYKMIEHPEWGGRTCQALSTARTQTAPAKDTQATTHTKKTTTVFCASLCLFCFPVKLFAFSETQKNRSGWRS